MKRIFLFVALIASAFFAVQSPAIPLQQAYDEAEPGAGYDKMVYLDPAEVYTGGILLEDGPTCILSCGALVDLQGDRIYVEPGTVLDICGVVLANSDSAALKYYGTGEGWIDHCTFVGNYDGLYFWEYSDMVITSNIFSYSSHWGVYTHTDADRWMCFNNAWANAAGNYKEYCPG